MGRARKSHHANRRSTVAGKDSHCLLYTEKTPSTQSNEKKIMPNSEIKPTINATSFFLMPPASISAMNINLKR
jgi:hypothetical protein